MKVANQFFILRKKIGRGIATVAQLDIEVSNLVHLVLEVLSSAGNTCCIVDRPLIRELSEANSFEFVAKFTV